MIVVLVTGGFDPLHSGHIEYFKAARQLGDKLIVGLNSDKWLARKKGQPFMPITERFAIVSSIDVVDEVIVYNDDDGSSIDAIRLVQMRYPNNEIIFANGGDRTVANIPEMSCKNVIFKFGVGGEDKRNSSSWLLQEWKQPKILRQWGYYRILHDVTGCKVKELTVGPGKSLSMQKHFKRNEYWLVTEGKCEVKKELETLILHKHATVQIKKGQWHKLSNPFTEPCRLVEIQYGEICIEEDIERQNA